jgi:hypothetical protein
LRTVLQRAGRHVGGSGRWNQGLKKTYLLNVDGKNRDRLLDASKHDIRKYVKRERAKALPEGVDFLDFDCKVGASDVTAAPVHFSEVMAAVDALVKDGADQFYAEINSKSGHRLVRLIIAADSENTLEKPEVS